MRPATSQAGQHVVELGQFDLRSGLTAPGSPREDVEDEARSIDDPGPDQLFQVARLRG